MTSMFSDEYHQSTMKSQADATGKAEDKSGIVYWMQRAVQECDRAAPDFAPDPVHDLRVALRRCRSLAEGFASFDPDPSWNEMRKAGGRLFKRLGELRDAQVMIELMENQGAPRDDAASMLIDYLAVNERDLKAAVLGSLKDFDIKKWTARTARLSKRAARIPPDGPAFRHLALERWHQAYVLHRQALRNRTHIGFHRLRISLKKFRYIVENFLPSLHAYWGADLRALQDLLGEMHDIYVLLRVAINIRAFHNEQTRHQWQSWMEEEIRQRLNLYRIKMTRRDSLWRIWRAELPKGDELESAVIERLRTWASFRDPDTGRSKHSADLALQLYDGLAHLNMLGAAAGGRSRKILRASALMHAVGFSARGKKYQKASYRVINRLPAPIGWESDDLKIASLAVRYHRGPLPKPGRKQMRGLSAEKQQTIRTLCGILRLVITLGSSRRTKISGVSVSRPGEALVVIANGYQPYDSLAQNAAHARYLLEIVVGLPIIICGSEGIPFAH